jgi:hypothetical protein
MRLIFIILTPIAPHTGCAKWYSYIKYANTHRHVLSEWSGSGWISDTIEINHYKKKKPEHLGL